MAIIYDDEKHRKIAWQKKYVEENKEHVRNRKSEWSKKNRKRLTENQKKWMLEHPEFKLATEV